MQATNSALVIAPEADLAPTSKPISNQEKKSVFFPNLDGIRFFSFLSVFLAHSFFTKNAFILNSPAYKFVKLFLLHNAGMGVNCFFVLSGFLITYLLLTEKEKYGNIKIGHFYIRRILRIWPLFYFCVAFGFFIFPKFKIMLGQPAHETAHIAYYLVFLNNFDLFKYGADSSVLSVLWSIAVEEQFYLVWPVLLFFLPKKWIVPALSIIITASFISRYVHADNRYWRDTSTFACISDMTVGGLSAYFAFNSRRFIDAIANAATWKWVILYLTIPIVFVYDQQIFEHGPFLTALGSVVIASIFALVILEQNYAKNSFYKMSNFKNISKLGTYTYGMYCLHSIALLIVLQITAKLGLNKNIYQVFFLEAPISLITTIIIAIGSYHLYEKRFLALKDRFARITRK